ncbi:putative transcriptional regulator,HTH IclR (plasmid) [Cupriavidus taiwanensis]|uniref:Putative transcriptional regulator,HTH IclR n=2 Tax=Cupriavidus taiwanensis TaxID=164546 RepID=A0A375HI86_9BURK|nr:putative transcriptional regulator,HTH IclR [Cupriavidus taiwanensis]SOY66720.1 putative transcriptional regulator,HTH IclR [Cupriavidus taiwanensis]SOY94749.1 putative transcriptional regulator,HTH IclR [Cupriavidus taiwanensis]SOZ28097.1 putative transcriptional regulator,HTH IclR [Cupriavidus taiwanensis]SOZ71519.1 putative transcriptional regulator,HTH IclR [Cupriavidus taiwanensis]
MGLSGPLPMKRTTTIPTPPPDAAHLPVPADVPAGNGCADDRNFVTALARGMELLRAFGPQDDYLGNAELSRRTGIPRPTVSRLTYTLATLGYLTYIAATEKYRLGQGAMVLGHRYVGGAGIREIAQPLMQSLAFATDCTVALAMPDRHAMVYLESCQPRGALVIRLAPGARLPMATSAIGRAWLAGLDADHREAALAELARHYGARWPAVRAGVERALRDHARRGFCVAHAEWDRTVSGAAAPLRLAGSSEVLALNIGGAAARLSPEILEANLGPRVRELAQTLQARLWQPGGARASARFASAQPEPEPGAAKRA